MGKLEGGSVTTDALQGAGEHRAKVLVVDDTRTIVRTIGAMLTAAGYAVVTAASGEEALQRCFDEHFDVVVSDITMGALSGVQLCRLLRSDPATKDVPVVLLTAADDPRSRFWGRNAGAAAYVAKERARVELLPEVERVLRTTLPSTAPLRTRAGRRAQPMERLSQVLDELLFRAVVSQEVRTLIHDTDDRQRFSRTFLRIAADVADYSYLVLCLKHREDASFAIHARAPFHETPAQATLEALDLPAWPSPSIYAPVSEGPLLTTPDPGFEPKDRVKAVISSADESLGWLIAIGRDKRLGGEDRATLEQLARELGVLVKNLFLLEETQRLAHYDGLTGLQNRRRTTERLEIEIARARRYRTPLCLAIGDVDHFKSVNDRFGHNMGDQVLVHVAGALQQSVREVDLVGRWGGEEFLIVLPDTNGEGALVVAERVRAAVEGLAAFPGGPERVTISIGVSQFRSDDTTASFVDRADQALYRSKQGGRNRSELG
jgi:two-component system cell cycle response regulator